MIRKDRRPATGAIVFGLVATFLGGCAHTHKVVPVTAKMPAGDYVYYALPRTVVEVTIGASISSVNPEPRCVGHIREVGLKMPRIQSGKYFTLGKATLAKHAEADPGKRFAVDLDGTGAAELGLTLNERGALTKGASSSTDVIVPILTGTLEMAATIAGAAIGGGSPEVVSPGCATEIRSLNQVRNQIYGLHESRGAADSKEVLQYKLAKLTTAAKQLEALFTGVVVGPARQIQCELRPANTSPTVLLTWSKSGGLASLDDSCTIAEGKAVLEIAPGDAAKSTELTNLADTHSVNLAIAKRTDALSEMAFPATRGGERSFYYRIPAFATLQVDDHTGSGSVRISDRVEWALPQLGEVQSLPRMRSTGTTRAEVTLDPETGALLTATTKTTEADFGSAASGIGKNVAGVLEARAKADVDVDEELAALQREKALLEAELAIKVAKAALGEE